MSIPLRGYIRFLMPNGEIRLQRLDIWYLRSEKEGVVVVLRNGTEIKTITSYKWAVDQMNQIDNPPGF